MYDIHTYVRMYVCTDGRMYVCTYVCRVEDKTKFRTIKKMEENWYAVL